MGLVVVIGLSLWSMNRLDAFIDVRAQGERSLLDEVSDQCALIMQSTTCDAAGNTIIWVTGSVYAFAALTIVPTSPELAYPP
jgi:hypothetical protein